MQVFNCQTLKENCYATSLFSVKYMLLQWQMLMSDMVKMMTTVSQKTATNTPVQYFILFLIIMVLHDVT